MVKPVKTQSEHIIEWSSDKFGHESNGCPFSYHGTNLNRDNLSVELVASSGTVLSVMVLCFRCDFN